MKNYNNILRKYKDEINKHMDDSLKIQLCVTDEEIHRDIFTSAILNMCIKYEAMTAELEEDVFHKKPRYNKPWSNTRLLSKSLNIDISKEYKVAHDMWDVYNSLKHVNDTTTFEMHRMMRRYRLESIKEAAFFMRDCLVDLINRLNIKKD